MTTQVTHSDRQELQPDEEANRYSQESILRSEFMYGEGFQSPGGIEAVEGFCSQLSMHEGISATGLWDHNRMGSGGLISFPKLSIKWPPVSLP